MRRIAENLFVEESRVRFLGFRLQTRMTVIRLRGGQLLVHSPIFLTEAVKRELESQGEVAFVVSPNKLHHQALSDYAEAFPEALLYASPGLPERRPDLRFAGVLGDEPEPGWAGELDQVATRGNVFFSEVLFFHRPSRSLIAADLVENFERGTVSTTGRLAARLFGVGSRPVASPEFRLYTTDADAAAESFERALAWDFRRIVLAHGALVESDARETFRAVCEELVGRVRRRRHGTRAVLARMARFQ